MEVCRFWLLIACIGTRYITNSHGSAVRVRECFKGDEAYQCKRPKFDPSPQQNPLNRSSQKLAGVITSWTAPGMENVVAIGSGVSVSQIRDFAVLFDVISSFFRLQLLPYTQLLRLQDNSPTNQLAVSQVADWITRGLVNSPTASFKKSWNYYTFFVH